jgi:hypothetical protein
VEEPARLEARDDPAQVARVEVELATKVRCRYLRPLRELVQNADLGERKLALQQMLVPISRV